MEYNHIIGYCVLGGIILCLSYIAWNLSRKNAIYEQWIVRFEDRVHEAYAKLKTIDDQNMFEKDDDVGFIFTELVSITEELNEKLGDPDAEEDRA